MKSSALGLSLRHPAIVLGILRALPPGGSTVLDQQRQDHVEMVVGQLF
jgi:hypothetical protein